MENAIREDVAMKIFHPLLAQAVVALTMTATNILAKEKGGPGRRIMRTSDNEDANAFGRGRHNHCC